MTLGHLFYDGIMIVGGLIIIRYIILEIIDLYKDAKDLLKK